MKAEAQRGARRPVRALHAAAVERGAEDRGAVGRAGAPPLHALHGAPAAEWQINVTETAPMAPRLACAVDRELIPRSPSSSSPRTCGSLRCSRSWSPAFNRIRKTRRQRLVLDRGRGARPPDAGAHPARRVGRRSAARRADERWRGVLPEILERESAFLGLVEPCTRVIVCAQGEFDTEMHDAWRTQALELPRARARASRTMTEPDATHRPRFRPPAAAPRRGPARLLLAVALGVAGDMGLHLRAASAR